MPVLKLTCSLRENLAAMKALFQGDNTFVTRETESPSGLRCAVFFIDGMVNNLAINQSIIRPLVACDRPAADADLLAHTVIQINDSKVVPDEQQMLSALLYGDTVILTEGDARPVVVNTKGFSVRWRPSRTTSACCAARAKASLRRLCPTWPSSGGGSTTPGSNFPFPAWLGAPTPWSVYVTSRA